MKKASTIKIQYNAVDLSIDLTNFKADEYVLIKNVTGFFFLYINRMSSVYHPVISVYHPVKLISVEKKT